MWAEVAMENRGRSAVTVDWIVRHADGRRHPATAAGTVIAPGETHTMKAVSEENGPMEYGWARITAHSKDRPRLKITAWAYGLDGDKLTRYSRTVTPGKDMDRSFLMAWKNGEEGRRLYAINDTPEETPVEICYGRATITTKRIFRSSRTTMRCDEKEEFPVPAGGTRVVRVTRPGQVFATFASGGEGEVILAGAYRVEGDTSTFNVESSLAFEEPR